ncbi:hypothetical protein Tco_0919458 [Tanacetum coccineum]
MVVSGAHLNPHPEINFLSKQLPSLLLKQLCNSACVVGISVVLYLELSSLLRFRINLEKEVASDVTTVDVLNSYSPELTKGGLESVGHWKGLVVNMAAGGVYEEVFTIPTTLHPEQSFNHRLPLKEGTLPIQTIPYRCPLTLKEVGVVIRELFDPGGKRVYDQTTKVNNGIGVHGQVSLLVPDPLLDQGNIEVPAATDFVHTLVPELLDADKDTGFAFVDTWEWKGLIQAHRNPLSILTDPSGVYHIRARSRKNLPRSSETGQYAASVALSEDAATEPNSNTVTSTNQILPDVAHFEREIARDLHQPKVNMCQGFIDKLSQQEAAMFMAARLLEICSYCYFMVITAAAGCYGVNVITTVNTDVDDRISTIACKLLLWSHFKQEKKQQIGSRLEQVYVWFLDSDSIKFLKAIFGIIEELITKIIVYYLFEDEVEFHRINVVVLSVSFNRINEDSIKRLRSTYTWVLQIKVAYVPYWNSNFNKPVDIITECNMEQKPVDIIKESSVEQKEDRKEDNYHVASDIVRGKFVNKYAKREECESLSFDKRLDIGLEIQTVAAITETLSSSLRTVGANEHTICPNIQKGVCLFRRCCDLKHVEGFNANEIATADVGINLEKEVASDITTVDVLNSESPEGGLESVGHWKGLVVNMAAGGVVTTEGRHITYPLTVKEVGVVIRELFDPGGKRVYDQTTKVNNGIGVHGQVSLLVPDPLLDQGNIEVPAATDFRDQYPENLKESSSSKRKGIQAHRNPLSILTDPSGVYHIRARSRKNLPRSSETGQYPASVTLSEDAATKPNSNTVTSTLGAEEGRVTSTEPFIPGISSPGFSDETVAFELSIVVLRLVLDLLLLLPFHHELSFYVFHDKRGLVDKDLFFFVG